MGFLTWASLFGLLCACCAVHGQDDYVKTRVTSSKGIKNTQRIYDDCSHALRNGKKKSGIYLVQPKTLADVAPFYVYCDMSTDGGRWLVFQRRMDGSFNFYRPWASYKNGFGRLDGEMWLGNEKIHLLSSQKRYQLRVDMTDDKNTQRYAVYDNFFFNDEYDSYKLHVANYSGDAGDSLTYHSGRPFSTYDRDASSQKCAKLFKGAWWYSNCHSSNLNGVYHKGNHTSFADGVNWEKFKGYHNSLVFTEMKMRPFY